MKNLHTQCTCGNKKKHLASCGCHKTSHCTCKLKAPKKPFDKRPLLQVSLSLQALIQPVSLLALVNLVMSHQYPDLMLPPQANVRGQPRAATAVAGPGELANNYIIEDVVLPFDTLGMFDLFSRELTPNRPLAIATTTDSKPEGGFGQTSQLAPHLAPHLATGESTALNTPQSASASQPPMTLEPGVVSGVAPPSAPSSSSAQPQPAVSGVSAIGLVLGGMTEKDEFLGPSDLDMVDRMFPLFPLVGLALLDNDDTLFIENRFGSRNGNSGYTNLGLLDSLAVAPTPVRPGLNRPELVLSDSLFDLPLSNTAYPPLDHIRPLALVLLGLHTDLFNPSNVFVDISHMDFESAMGNYGRTTPLIPEEYTGASIDGVFGTNDLRPDPEVPFSSIPPFSPQTSYQ